MNPQAIISAAVDYASEQDLHDPRKSIEAGAAILGILLDRYQGDIQKALRHYSGGATRYQEKIVRRVVG